MESNPSRSTKISAAASLMRFIAAHFRTGLVSWTSSSDDIFAMSSQNKQPERALQSLLKIFSSSPKNSPDAISNGPA